MYDERYLHKCIDVLFYLYKTKQWILEYKSLGSFVKIKTQGEELMILHGKIVQCNKMIGKSLNNYLIKQMELFEKEAAKI